MQKYKAVYFSDHPSETAKERSITLAFGSRSRDTYESVKDLSSEEVRLLLSTDSYQQLLASAEAENLPLNTYCLRKLRESIAEAKTRGPQLPLPGMEVQTQLFSPVTVTFRGGRKEPFQRWYPYLEGYSPEYVQRILEEYAPNAQVVLDPFAGTATTAFAAAEQGRTAYFCEINPVLQFVSQVKTRVRRLRPKTRTRLAEALDAETNEVESRIEAWQPDPILLRTYEDSFGDSEFFDEKTLAQVLQCRTWVDYVASERPLLAGLLTVAVLASLVPASRMQRAGDLRYKTPRELRTQMVPFPSAIAGGIAQIVQDLKGDGDGLLSEPILICEDARALAKVAPLCVDAVITSPPYVNGTNYFRNTKIELWFLRCLRTKQDLTSFRATAITAGINDVTVDKVPTSNRPEVEEVIRQLEAEAYDARIPRMIACYFGEMTEVFGAIRNHLTPNAVLAIDIGDSAYAGVHVPSDRLLAACLEDQGFSLVQEIALRRRKSRGGTLLKQSLLIFRYHRKESARPQKKPEKWRSGWQSFKDDLPHQEHPYTKRNWGHPLHSLCSYPGKLKPAIAHHLVSIFVPPQGSVLDPFAGVGTIPFEAALQSKRAYGFELSPAAFVIAAAKLKVTDQEECTAIIQDLMEFINTGEPTLEEMAEAQKFGFNGKVAEYYHSQTLKEVLLARRYFCLRPPNSGAELLVMASLLHILHGNRPYALSRRSHPLTPYKPTGDFEYRSLVERLRAKVDRSLSVTLPSGFREGKVYFQDATEWWPREIDMLDAIITSPPFFDSTRFYLANWIRLWFAGWSTTDFQEKPLLFVDERQKQSFRVYESVIRQARERLRSGGTLVLHLGKSRKCDMAAELTKIGKKWFAHSERFDESVAHCESHGIRDKGAVTDHQYLVLY
ncbi:MAG: hypothetical protein JXB30_05135 [Anaerolineae bacterium]|nr:hypothetical protein [Anaerolineae bacterium]